MTRLSKQSNTLTTCSRQGMPLYRELTAERAQMRNDVDATVLMFYEVHRYPFNVMCLNISFAINF